MGTMPGVPGEVDVLDIKPWIVALIAGIIFFIVGAAAGTVGVAVAKYIVAALNSTGTVVITSQEDFLSTVVTIIKPVFTITGVVLIVVAAFKIIRIMLESTGAIT